MLFGEEGVSETKELFIPEGSLFTRNSKETFIVRYQFYYMTLWFLYDFVFVNLFFIDEIYEPQEPKMSLWYQQSV